MQNVSAVHLVLSRSEKSASSRTGLLSVCHFCQKPEPCVKRKDLDLVPTQRCVLPGRFFPEVRDKVCWLPRRNCSKLCGRRRFFPNICKCRSQSMVPVSGEASARARLPRWLLPVHPLHKETGEEGIVASFRFMSFIFITLNIIVYLNKISGHWRWVLSDGGQETIVQGRLWQRQS